MSKTKKTLLSVLVLLFAFALVFTACLGFVGCGDVEDDEDVKSDEGVVDEGTPATRTVLVQGTGVKSSATDPVIALYSDGWIVIGTQSQVDSFAGSENGATLGYWGYLDGKLTYVRISGSLYLGTVSYVLFDATDNGDGTVTLDNEGVGGTFDATKLTGNGWDLSSLEIES